MIFVKSWAHKDPSYATEFKPVFSFTYYTLMMITLPYILIITTCQCSNCVFFSLLVLFYYLYRCTTAKCERMCDIYDIAPPKNIPCKPIKYNNTK